MDTTQVTKFFTRIYNQGDRFELAFIKPETKVARVVRVWGEDPEAVLDDIERGESAGYNVYSSAMPLGVQEQRAYDRVWIDQDDPDAPYPFASDPEWDGPAWPKPTTLVKTSDAEGGFRYQAIWRLSEALPADDGRGLIRRLAARAGADASVHDPRRVLRVPGTMNAKRGSMARLMETSQGTVSPEAFNLPDEDTVEALLTMEVSAPHHVLGEWLAGTDEGDRSRKAYVASRFLKGCGVTYDDALAIIATGARRSSPPLSDHEVVHAVSSAYHRQETR